MGLIIVLGTMTSALRSFVLARSARDAITSLVFRTNRRIFNLWLVRCDTYEDRDRIMAMYAPISLILLPLTWLAFGTIGFTLIYWGLGVGTLERAMIISGSSIMTLGSATDDRTLFFIIEFIEAAFGIILTAVLISYLPTMYSAFSRRETLVTMLEVRASAPPSALDMIIRAHSIRGLEALNEIWRNWEQWFAEIEESHTSLPALVFFRSTKPGRSWITAAGAVLDAASLHEAVLDVPINPDARLCIRSGFLALRHIADFFLIDYDPDPHFPAHPISISRIEFDEVYDQLKEAGVPVKPDRDQCWLDFAGWRVNYDTVLLRLAALTLAPYAPWSSDRSLPGSNFRPFSLWVSQKDKKMHVKSSTAKR
ncbi:MAG: hypothetical protein MUF87_03015 [Anaerolineae bacterium]|nr:hypothetical protein [Anaerolineae bacterium]